MMKIQIKIMLKEWIKWVTYNFDKREERTREYVTVNGEKCEDKEITLEDGKLYEIVYYYDYANSY